MTEEFDRDDDFWPKQSTEPPPIVKKLPIIPEEIKSSRMKEDKSIAITPEKFKELPKDKKNEVIKKHNEKIKDYDLVTWDKKELRKILFSIALIVTLLIGIFVFSNVSNKGAFKSSMVCSPNITNIMPNQSGGIQNCNCSPVLNCSYPSQININCTS